MGGGSGVAVRCGGGDRCGLDLVLPWLWCGLAGAALIQPLAWELPHASRVALKRQKKKKKKKKEKELCQNVAQCGKSTLLIKVLLYTTKHGTASLFFKLKVPLEYRV